MTNEQINENGAVPAVEVEDNASRYIAALDEMRANTVDRREYEKVMNENQRLIDAVMKGDKITAKEETKVDVNQLRKELYGGETELSNLNYISKTLELREALIKKGERDPFLPVGDKTVLTADMKDSANEVADLLKHCVQFADGDSGLFDAELSRHTAAPIVPIRRR
jgi:hypothetical protein